MSEHDAPYLLGFLGDKATEVIGLALRLAPELSAGEVIELGDLGLSVEDVARVRAKAQALRAAADRVSASLAAFAIDEFGAGEARFGNLHVRVSETGDGDWKPIPEMVPSFAEFLRSLPDEKLIEAVAKWRVTPLGAGKDTFLEKQTRLRPEIVVSTIEALPPRTAERVEALPDGEYLPRR